MGNASLYQRFFNAAKLDLDAAKILKDKELYQPALYHLQQAYEKCVKSYFILMETKLKNIPEATAYHDTVYFKHKIEESTIALLKYMITIEEDEYNRKLSYLLDHEKIQLDQEEIQALNKVLAVIKSYKSSLDAYAQRLGLSKNYVNIVQHYSNSTTAVYTNYQNSKRIINNIVVKEEDKRFLYIFSCMTNVYPVLYNIELISRYPLSEFSYDNLDLLANQHDACQKIIEMLGEMFTLVSRDFR